jgi:hypothetical protein
VQQTDIVDSVAMGYKKAWEERAYLLRLAAVPALVKLICLVLVFATDHMHDFLRQTLILLPAHFLEGWLLAQFLRTLLCGERWPIKIDTEREDHILFMMRRARGIISAVLIYVLIKMGLGALMAAGDYARKRAETRQETTGDTPVKDSATTAETPAKGTVSDSPAPDLPAQMGPEAAIAGLVLVGVLIWAFRYLWLYIPAAVNMPLTAFANRMGGFMTSLRLLGVWLIAVTPVLLIGVMLTSIMLGNYEGQLDQAPTLISFLILCTNVIVELLIAIVATAAIAIALRHLMPPGQSDIPPAHYA